MKSIYCSVAAAVLTACIGFSGDAIAGFKERHEVTINTEHRFAKGAMGSVRNSRDSDQWIGCQISVLYGGAASNGSCWARDAAGKVAACHFNNRPEFESIVSGLSDSSLIYFTWDQPYQCRQITAQIMSTYEPRK